jgi:hypothetical protein
VKSHPAERLSSSAFSDLKSEGFLLEIAKRQSHTHKMRILILAAAFVGVTVAHPGIAGNGGGGGGYSNGGGFGGGSSYSNGGGGGGGGGGYGAPAPVYGAPQQAPVVHKHIYVHVPPPEPSYAPKRRPQQSLPPPQKHYKIIFIKAPTPPPPTLPDIPQIAPPAEQKTLIYVLVKKPDEGPGEIVIPTPAPTKPSKPEVYFIRYKGPKQGYSNGGGYGGGGGGGGYPDSGYAASSSDAPASAPAPAAVAAANGSPAPQVIANGANGYTNGAQRAASNGGYQ